MFVNRAPVLTLWAAVVAERLGYDRNEALSLGKALSGLNAQSKGQRLGIYQPKEKGEAAKARPAREVRIPLMGREIPAVQTAEGVRAVKGETPVTPESCERYLQSKFSEHLLEVRQAMEELARAFPAEELADRAYALYAKFRPEVPEGTKGWGAKGKLSLSRMRALARG